MPLDPFDEHFDLPEAHIEKAQIVLSAMIVGQGDKRLARLGILESDAAQLLGKVLAGLHPGQSSWSGRR